MRSSRKKDRSEDGEGILEYGKIERIVFYLALLGRVGVPGMSERKQRSVPVATVAPWRRRLPTL